MSAGVSFILFTNLIQNLFYLATATTNIILKIPTFGAHTDVALQTFNAACCLLGLPFIAGAIWGVMYRLESPLRLYLGYKAVCFVIDVIFVLQPFIFGDICGSMPSVLSRHGAAFACGFMKIVSILFASQILIVEAYFIFTIWSLCEDFKSFGSGFPDLLREKQVSIYRYQGNVVDHYNAAGTYGATSFGRGLGRSTGIFKGDLHETAYPPPRSERWA